MQRIMMESLKRIAMNEISDARFEASQTLRSLAPFIVAGQENLGLSLDEIKRSL